MKVAMGIRATTPGYRRYAVVFGWLAVWLAVLAAFARPGTIPQSAYAQTGGSLYFAETGHSVQGSFLELYNSVSDPLKIFGYPITDEFIAPRNSASAGLKVQYFQRARFEVDPTQANEQIKLAPLGRNLFNLDQPGSPPLVLPQNHPACRYFVETGRQVCYAFLTFFDNNGGVKIFGLPVSETVTINDRLVQYFENARFEWRPELPSGQRVTLTNVGAIYFHIYEDPFHLLPPLNNAIPNTILSLQVRVFPVSAVMQTSGKQTIYVIVQDQQLRPVVGAQVSLTLRRAGQPDLSRAMPITDQQGISTLTLGLENQPIGLTEILVQVNYNTQLQKQTRASYRVWW